MVFDLDIKYTAAMLAEFIAEHPELKLIYSAQELDSCWPEWEVNLIADFTVKVEGIEDDCVVRVAWEEFGDSQNEFKEFIGPPRYKITVPGKKKYCGICMSNNKWHIVDDKSADKVAQHFNQVEHEYNQNEKQKKIQNDIRIKFMNIIVFRVIPTLIMVMYIVMLLYTVISSD